MIAPPSDTALGTLAHDSIDLSSVFALADFIFFTLSWARVSGITTTWYVFLKFLNIADLLLLFINFSTTIIKMLVFALFFSHNDCLVWTSGWFGPYRKCYSAFINHILEELVKNWYYFLEFARGIVYFVLFIMKNF